MAGKELVKINLDMLGSESKLDLDLHLSQNCAMKSQEWQDEIKSKLADIYSIKKEDIELDWYFKPKVSAYNELFKDFANSGKNYRLFASLKGEKFKINIEDDRQNEPDPKNRTTYTKAQMRSISKAVQQISTLLEQNNEPDLHAMLKEKLNGLISKLLLPETIEQSVQNLIGSVVSRLIISETEKAQVGDPPRD